MRRSILLLLLFAVAIPVLAGPKKPVTSWKKGQQQPDAKRMHEIAQALYDKGYIVNNPDAYTWLELQAVCKGIQNKMEWQIDFMPDARVMVLLGLGNSQSDPIPSTLKGNRLDKAQRIEYFRHHPEEAP